MSIRLRKPLANVWKNIIKVKILLFLDFLHNETYNFYDTNWSMSLQYKFIFNITTNTIFSFTVLFLEYWPSMRFNSLETTNVQSTRWKLSKKRIRQYVRCLSSKEKGTNAPTIFKSNIKSGLGANLGYATFFHFPFLV